MTTNSPPVGLSATEWAREHGDKFSYHASLDNYEPVPRGTAYGHGYFYDLRNSDGRGIILEGVEQFRDSSTAVYLIDDCRTVQPFYVAGWGPENDHVMLHPFPTNFTPDGTPRQRADDGRPVDFSGWSIGPSRCYHLKITAHD